MNPSQEIKTEDTDWLNEVFKGLPEELHELVVKVEEVMEEGDDPLADFNPNLIKTENQMIKISEDSSPLNHRDSRKRLHKYTPGPGDCETQTKAESTFRCGECLRLFRSKILLHKHLRVHSDSSRQFLRNKVPKTDKTEEVDGHREQIELREETCMDTLLKEEDSGVKIELREETAMDTLLKEEDSGMKYSPMEGSRMLEAAAIEGQKCSPPCMCQEVNLILLNELQAVKEQLAIMQQDIISIKATQSSSPPQSTLEISKSALPEPPNNETETYVLVGRNKSIPSASIARTEKDAVSLTKRVEALINLFFEKPEEWSLSGEDGCGNPLKKIPDDEVTSMTKLLSCMWWPKKVPPTEKCVRMAIGKYTLKQREMKGLQPKKHLSRKRAKKRDTPAGVW